MTPASPMFLHVRGRRISRPNLSLRLEVSAAIEVSFDLFEPSCFDFFLSMPLRSGAFLSSELALAGHWI